MGGVGTVGTLGGLGGVGGVGTLGGVGTVGGLGGVGGVLSETELQKKPVTFIRRVDQLPSSFPPTCVLAPVRSSCISASCCCPGQRLLGHYGEKKIFRQHSCSRPDGSG